MNKSTKILLVSGVVLALLYGAYVFVQKNMNKISETTYRFQRFKIEKASLTDFRFSTEVVLTNQSDISLTITGYDISVQIQNTPLLNIQDDSLNVDIPSNQSFTIPIFIKFDPRKLGSTILQLLMAIQSIEGTTEKIKVRFVGTISGKMGAVGVKNIPIDYTEEI